jgi:hypothetical protein
MKTKGLSLIIVISFKMIVLHVKMGENGEVVAEFGGNAWIAR